jgi:glycosyltransferase involved in cell wall biosynthesis
MITGIIEPIGGHGGMDYYDYGLGYGLAKNGVNIRFYTCDKTKIRTYENVTTITSFKKMWNANILVKSYKYLLGHYKAFKDLKANKSKLAHLHFFTFRIIDLICLILGKSLGLKLVVTIHDITALDASANSVVEHYCYKLMDTVIVHNKYSYMKLRSKHSVSIPIRIIPHGNYLPFIAPIDKQNNQDSVFTLLFFGQIKKVKGVDILLEAVAYVANKGYKLVLLLAGKPWKTDLQYYQRLIKDLKIEEIVKTDFRYIPDDEVPLFYSKADLVVLPYREIYQSGAVLLAMSYNKPVLCSNLNSFKEIINHQQNGLLFKNEDIEDLSNKIIYAMNNKSSLQLLAENSTKIIKDKFDWINVGKLTKEIYNNCLSLS